MSVVYLPSTSGILASFAIATKFVPPSFSSIELNSNDSTFAFINNVDENEEMFLDIQKYLLSDAGKKMLEENGQRTWYGGKCDIIAACRW